MFGQQITGQAFVNQYSAIFYQQNGFAKEAFLFTVLATVADVIGTAMTWAVVDTFGRRYVTYLWLPARSIDLHALQSHSPNWWLSNGSVLIHCYNRVYHSSSVARCSKYDGGLDMSV